MPTIAGDLVRHLAQALHECRHFFQKRDHDDGDTALAFRQELETLYRFILGTAYRLADILEPWEDD